MDPLKHILFNPRAGRRGSRTRLRLDRLLEEACLPVEVREVDPSVFAAEIDRMIAARCDRIAVAGGDGSLHSAATHLAGTRVALLPIPTGTLNHFARRLGFEELEQAIEAIESGRTEEVPIGVVDHRIFLNTATFGLYANVVRRRERWRRVLGKWPAAALGFTLTMARLQRLDLVVQLEGEYLRRSTPVLWVGLGWGSFPRVIGATERRSSPDLEIVFIRAGSRFGSAALLARLVRHFLSGRRPITDPGLEILHARSLLIHAPHPIDVTLDGEVLRVDPPVFVAVQDGGLKVVVPATA